MFDLIESILLHVTGKCNLNCKHCYVSDFSEKELNETSFNKFLDIATVLNKPIDITGGEPFVHSKISLFVKKLLERNLQIGSIFTNGTIIHKYIDILQMLKNSGSNCWFYISLDGYLETHNSFRNTNTFNTVIENASILKEIGFNVSINSILHNQFSKKDIELLFDTIAKNNFNRWRVDTPFNSGNWVANNHLGISIENAFHLFAYIIELWDKNGRPFDFELNHTLKYIDKRFFFLDNFLLSDSICPCKILTIWPDGKATWCQDIYDKKSIIGNINQKPENIYKKYAYFKSLTISSFLEESIRQNNNKDCVECMFLENCGTGCRANSFLNNNGLFGKDKEICHIYKESCFKIIADKLISIHK